MKSSAESVPTPLPNPCPQNSLSEDQFYSQYEWCLNPLQTVGDLLIRLRDELDRFHSLTSGWQREESRINLYLLVCALSCTTDDYLAWKNWDLSVVSSRFPQLRFAIDLVEKLLNAPAVISGFLSQRRVIRWLSQLEACVDLACELLASAPEENPDCWAKLRSECRGLLSADLPERLLKRRMRINEGFRCQDMTHRDVFAMVDKFLQTGVARTNPVVIVGPRTAGAYFAPLAKAYLAKRGWAHLSWISIRPKEGVSAREKARLKRLLDQQTHVLVIDDFQNTGKTFLLTRRLLEQLGVEASRIVFLAPRHPCKPNWAMPEQSGKTTHTLLLEPGELDKKKLLEPAAVQRVLQEYAREQGWNDVCLTENKEVDEINNGLSRHSEDGFQARMKRLYEVQFSQDDHTPVRKRILAKSVGWGWLGYHAYVAGKRLEGFVPRVVGLRNGFLFTEWVEGSPLQAEREAKETEVVVSTLAAYVARRTQQLRIAEDPCFGAEGCKWTGWDDMRAFLRGVYGPYLGKLKRPALVKALRQYVSPMPTLVDGQMGPSEWIPTPQGLRKTDFEQHNFGGAETDVVDPAFDLAGAVFEFCLSPDDEAALIRSYTKLSGDQNIHDRFLMYKLLYGYLVVQRTCRAASRESSREKRELHNRRYLQARSFLTFQMSRYAAGKWGSHRPAEWTKNLFFLDLDGVFDWELLGMPHTTPSGVRALELLKDNGYSVVLNTARSVEHVWSYCRAYGLPGGLGEHGSVLVDAIKERELPLVHPEGTEQLALCLRVLAEMPGVCTDPGYKYSIRAYRYDNTGTRGLGASEVRELLDRHGLSRLECVLTPADTYIVQKGLGKAPGVMAIKKYLGFEKVRVAAVGDSAQDVGMLEAADSAYAPSNCAPAVRQLAKRDKLQIMGEPLQKGLLAAVIRLVGGTRRTPPQGWTSLGRDSNQTDIIGALLEVADRPSWQRWLSVLSLKTL